MNSHGEYLLDGQTNNFQVVKLYEISYFFKKMHIMLSKWLFLVKNFDVSEVPRILKR